MDDMDDIIELVKARSGGRVSRAEFKNIVQEAIKGR